MAYERLHEVLEHHHELVRPQSHHEPSFAHFRRAPYADGGTAPAQAGDAAGYEEAYVLVASTSPVPSAELDELGASAVEVTVLWGANVLHVSHLSPPRAFSIGHGGSVDFVVPPELAPFSCLSLVELRDGVAYVVAPRGAGLEARSGELRVTADGADGRRFAALVDGATVEVTLGALRFRVSSVIAAKRMPRYVGGDARGLGSSFLATFAAVAAFLGTLAYYTPAIGSTLDDGLDREQLATMLAILKADAEQERKVTPSEGDASSAQGGGTPGTAAKGSEGKTGRPDRPSTRRKFAIEGDGEVVLSREQLVAEAMNFGTVGLLTALNGRATPQALWGESVPNGPDASDAWGEMFGETIEESGGAGGLGLSGFGSGAGGYGDQLGIGTIGTCGTNCGMGNGKWGTGPGMGRSLGTTGHGHVAKAPSVRAGKTTVNGHIPAEVIQRIVRQNYGRFRQCYESGLRANPNLTGRVSARFVIGRDGSVTNVTNGGGDLPDSAVTSCVLAAFYGLSFPSPDGGIVTVTYPIMLVPG
jgi:hypothetical protein